MTVAATPKKKAAAISNMVVARIEADACVKEHRGEEDGMPQLITKFGKFTDGSLWVEDDQGHRRNVNTCHCPTVVEGHLLHGVHPVKKEHTGR